MSCLQEMKTDDALRWLSQLTRVFLCRALRTGTFHQFARIGNGMGDGSPSLPIDVSHVGRL